MPPEMRTKKQLCAWLSRHPPSAAQRRSLADYRIVQFPQRWTSAQEAWKCVLDTCEMRPVLAVVVMPEPMLCAFIEMAGRTLVIHPKMAYSDNRHWTGKWQRVIVYPKLGFRSWSRNRKGNGISEAKKLPDEALEEICRREGSKYLDYPLTWAVTHVRLLLGHIAAMEAEQQAVASRTASDDYELGMAMGDFVNNQTQRIQMLEGLLKRALPPLYDADYDEDSSALIAEIEKALGVEPL